MTRKHAIRDAEAHVTVSHGADFFGQDRHPLKSLKDLAPYVSNAHSWADREKVARLVHLLESPTEQTILAAEAALLGEQLLKTSRTRHMKPAMSALARALADAAGRAAEDGEPWVWHVESETGASPIG